jgi:hypothetical protein
MVVISSRGWMIKFDRRFSLDGVRTSPIGLPANESHGKRNTGAAAQGSGENLGESGTGGSEAARNVPHKQEQQHGHQ